MLLKQALLALLVSVSTAASTCTKNKCYSSVSRAPAAKSDCSSFQRAYVTPCSETRTRTITIIQTVTASPGSTQTFTETSYDSIVETKTTTVTSTVTKARVAARAAAPAVTTCSGLTIKPTATPTYARVCSSSKGFASACSCIGIPPTTTTLIPATTTETVFTVFTTTVGGDPVTTTTTTTVTTTGTITATQFTTKTVTK